MKIIFAGTPLFAAIALDALIKAGHEINLVLTQPDRPAGRGMKTASSAVKLLAQQHKLPLLQPLTLKAADIQAHLQALHADVMIVAAYGLILPQAVLNIPRLGCLNIHASLLPRWRGAAPIQRAILAGDHETGITIMQMDAGLDTGAILLKHNIVIAQNDTTQSLHDKLGLLGAQSVVEALMLLQQEKLTPVAQDEALACYAAKIKKADAEIDWQQTAEQVDRVVRTFNPSPGAFTYFQDNLLKIWQVSVVNGRVGQPGEIIAADRDGIIVACGSGLLRIEVMQKPGGKKLNAADYLSGNSMQPGEYFAAINHSSFEHD
ncbi:MAG: methionyl-tRNA formyltransferase [Nitrosomonas sp.]|nr:methionyl-tRNA formyltransferase [Nitrosomonas sp.]